MSRAGGGRTFAVLRHRDYALLWSGQTVSMVGDGIYNVALVIEALRIDRHGTGLALVLAARTVPQVLLLLVGGAVVDRIPRRLALLGADALRGAAVGAATALVALHALSLAELVAVSVAFGCGDAFFFPASLAVVPELVPGELLLGASSLQGTSTQLAQMLIGPALGGAIAGALGPAWGFGLDAASFATSAACLALMRRRPREPRRSATSIAHEIAEGLRYVRRERWLWIGLLAAGISNFVAFSPYAVLLPLLVEHSLRRGSVAFGLVIAAGGAGGVLSTLVLARLGSVRRRLRTTWAMWAVAALGIGLTGLAFDLPFAAGCVVVVFGFLAAGNALWSPVMQELVPSDLHGRVSSVDWLVSLSLSPLGIVAAGAIASHTGPRPVLVAGAALSLACGAMAAIPGAFAPDDARLAPSGPEDAS